MCSKFILALYLLGSLVATAYATPVDLAASANTETLADKPSLFDLSLLELMKLRSSSSASLTKVQSLKVPASVTRISSEMIRYSGARSLDELLELYVPNFQRAKSGGAGPHFGMRGIISDLDNKTLLLVNGRVMNHKALLGAFSERFMPLLGDIAFVEIVRGPGSAIYGPGAINGVINIQTHSPLTFEGAEINLRQGVVEAFSMGEMRLGHRFSENAGIFFYLGMDHYGGAAPEDSPLVYSKDGGFFSAGQGIVDPNLVNDNAARLGKPHHKAHLQLQWHDFEFWVRSTRGSVQYDNQREVIEAQGTFLNTDRSGEYWQLTLAARQKITLSQQVSLTLDGSYDQFDVAQDQGRLDLPGFDEVVALRENELNLRALLSWDIVAAHSLAFGLEYSRDWFGEDAEWLSNDAAHFVTMVMPQWSTDTYSLFGEYQWNLDPKWTIFTGGRADHHSYTDWLYSPKLALVFAATPTHQFKLLLNRSVRKSEDRELKLQHDRKLGPDTETIDSMELRHDWQLNQHLSHGLVVFYYQHKILGFLPQGASETVVGESAVSGIEFELTYHSGKHDFAFSHAYSQLLDFKLEDAGLINQVVTSEPYGYGSDLANWSPHLSKLNWHWQLNEKWRLDSSVTVYWGFPGAQDYTAYNNEVLGKNNRSQSDGRTDAFDASVFVNSGLNYQASDKVHFAVNLHNILGWVDKDLNKRNIYGRMAGYRSEAAAASLDIEIRF
jgi:outer membrane receptor for ferrienterochelin and colicin